MNSKIKITKEQIAKIERAVRRQIAKEQLQYDGRLAPKIIPDKKKQKNKQKCRKKVNREGC